MEGNKNQDIFDQKDRILVQQKSAEPISKAIARPGKGNWMTTKQITQKSRVYLINIPCTYQL